MLLPPDVQSWTEAFRTGELTVDEIHERFAAFNVTGCELSRTVANAIAVAQRELDAIRFGMCEAGQRGEIARILADLEQRVSADKRQVARKDDPDAA